MLIAEAKWKEAAALLIKIVKVAIKQGNALALANALQAMLQLPAEETAYADNEVFASLSPISDQPRCHQVRLLSFCRDPLVHLMQYWLPRSCSEIDAGDIIVDSVVLTI